MRPESALRAAGLAAVLLAATAPYFGVLFNPPVWDDRTFVFGQRALLECRSLPRILHPRNLVTVLPERSSSRPVWMASVALDSCWGGGSPVAYRVGSLFWHALGALLVALLARRLSGDAATAWAAGLLFASHPVHTEAIAIITFRSDLLCLAFLAAALLLYRRGLDAAGVRRAAALAAGLLCGGAALLSKEMGVAFSLLPLMADAFFPVRTPGARRARWIFVAAALAMTAAYARFHSRRAGYGQAVAAPPKTAAPATPAAAAPPPAGTAPARPGAVSAGHAGVTPAPEPPARGLTRGRPKEPPPWRRIYGDPAARLRTMSAVFGSYLRVLSWPSRLQGDYAPDVIDRWGDPRLLAAWASWLALLVGAWTARRRLPLAGFGVLWTAVALGPATGIVPILNLQADRYLYVASAGWCMAGAAALVAAGRALGERGTAAALACAAALAVAGGARAARRVKDFRSERAFHEATLAEDPDVPRARLGLALECDERGDAECARENYEAVLRLWPESTSARQAYRRFRILQERGSRDR